MFELNKYKIEKMIGLSSPFNLLFDVKNLVISKESCGTLDISALLGKNIYPFSFDFANKIVIFVETEKVIPHNDTAFFHMPLQLLSEYIIPVPFRELKKLVLGAEIKHGNLLFIHHPGRCGSTLLHKILGSNPNVEAFSEDLILDNLILRMHDERVSFDEIRSIYTSIMDLLMIKWSDSGNKIISLKMCSFSHHYVHFLFQMLPDSRHIYLTREPLEIAVSMENISRKPGSLFGQKRKDPSFTFRKSELSNYFDLDHIKKDIIEKGGYGQYINKYITPEMKSAIGPMDFIERIILRTILIDSFYYSIKHEKMLYLTYTQLMNKELLFKRLQEFMYLEENSPFNEKAYEKHSQTNTVFKSPNTKYFDLTDVQKEKYTLFTESVKRIISPYGEKTQPDASA
jgi:hypothetical protein